MSDEKPPSQGEQVAKALEAAPRYLVEYIVGLIVHTVSDVIMTSLAVGSALLAIYTEVWIGIAAYFLLYVIVKTFHGLTSATGQGLVSVATQIDMTNQIAVQAINKVTSPPEAATEDDPSS